MTLDELNARRAQLQRLMVEVDRELAATEAAIRMHVEWPGRPRKPLTMTLDEARALHARYRRGERTPEVVQGHREYGRHHARLRRTRDAA